MYGYIMLVLVQHLNYLIEKFFMSSIHAGLPRTMKATAWKCYGH
ncbi:hypothetical protein F443_13702 [Phytophthora nicotianae P1569]|uniref:Uncharacterized protein n=2 Tax=Phytophthora nicotianae TaxID=4792 RepID=V9EP74_PHYNI|nr:hypothetical protein F443_13702 [Phytophthora nicotianae P1569]ETO58743.1 hypothetical protein F444_22878 [Phytophthora nicotianae P1976]